MPLLSRKRLILAKIEATYGTDPTPTGAEAILVRNLEITPLEAETVSRELIRPYLGASDQLLAQTRVGINFEVELAGSGTAGSTAAASAHSPPSEADEAPDSDGAASPFACLLLTRLCALPQLVQLRVPQLHQHRHHLVRVLPRSRNLR